MINAAINLVARRQALALAPLSNAARRALYELKRDNGWPHEYVCERRDVGVVERWLVWWRARREVA